MTPQQIAIIVIVLLVLGFFVFPVINRNSFRKLPEDQKIRVLMKEAKGLAYFKNVSSGSSGILYFVKNKRKILMLPWELKDGKMLCTRELPFTNWDYPEEHEKINDDELKQLNDEIEKYNKKSAVKLIFK